LPPFSFNLSHVGTIAEATCLKKGLPLGTDDPRREKASKHYALLVTLGERGGLDQVGRFGDQFELTVALHLTDAGLGSEMVILVKFLRLGQGLASDKDHR
jgi:hypothetical protein